MTLSLIPPQFRSLFWIAVAASLVAVGWVANGWRLNAERDAEAAERKQAENVAILTRIKNNERQVEQDKANSARIAKEHKNEMDKVHADIANSGRVRVGPEFCRGFTEGAKADSAGSGNAADTGTGVLLEEMDGLVKALIEEMERVAATGRAEKEFIRSNGMAPE